MAVTNVSGGGGGGGGGVWGCVPIKKPLQFAVP